MDYQYVSDPRLREALKKARDKNKVTLKLTSEPLERDINKNKVNDSINIKKKNIKSNNTKFDSLKVSKKLKKRKKLKSPSTKNLALATKQLSSMIRTGLPLLEALNILAESSEDKTLKIVFSEASLGISRGSTFVSILEKYPNVFDEMYLALISAGETAGLLPEVLEREALLLESLSRIKGQIRSALAYPIAIFCLTFVVIIIMLVFVIPIFVDMYASSGAELPGLTKLLVDGSELLRNPMFLFKSVPVLTILFLFLRNQFKKEYFLNIRDINLLKLPITKDLITKSNLANFSRTLSALNSAGVPILESILISKRTLGNRVFRRIADKMNTEIQSGQPLYKVLMTESVIPVMFASMFRIGEETGELSEMVNKLADFYEEEVSSSVKALTSILEPLMIVFVASIVAFILIAMYLPMFNMMSTVN